TRRRRHEHPGEFHLALRRRMKRNPKKRGLETLSPLEHVVMEFLWPRGRSSAEDVRRGLEERWPMKDSTARTVLRRLETKGFLRHTVEGRTYFYESVEAPESVAFRAVRRIADRFFQGSVESLVV